MLIANSKFLDYAVWVLSEDERIYDMVQLNNENEATYLNMVGKAIIN